MKIYLATGNKNKKKEMCELLPEHTILIPSDEGIDFDPDETGTTFYENSLIKARTLYDIVHCPVIADDSGICVDALGGAPGIFLQDMQALTLCMVSQMAQKSLRKNRISSLFSRQTKQSKMETFQKELTFTESVPATIPAQW